MVGCSATYVHEMGIKEGGKLALLASVGPMGLGAIDYALHCDRLNSALNWVLVGPAKKFRQPS